MPLIHWNGALDPFRDLRTLQDRMNRIFQAPGNGAPARTATVDPTVDPTLDVRSDADAVTITAEVPGVPLEAIRITVVGDTLTLEGERKARDVAEERYHRRERRWGKFQRVLKLPERVAAEKIEATLKDGILRIRLPKAESAKPRQIRVAQG